MTLTYAYYLALGSNLEPAVHFSTALDKLQAKFGRLLVWPTVTTPPVAMNTPHAFVNTLVVLHSDWSPSQLKRWTNALEVHCGRDRSDPLRAHKDRPLDIDILAQQSQFDLQILDQFTEPYVRAVIAAGNPQPLAQDLSQGSATIHTQHTGGHVMIVEERVDSHLQSIKPALNREQCLG